MGFSIGEILVTAGGILVRRFVPFAVIAFATYLPLILLPYAWDPERLAGHLVRGLLLPIPLFFVMFSAVSHGVMRDLRGSPVTLMACIESGFLRLPGVLAAAFLALVTVFLAALPLGILGFLLPVQLLVFGLMLYLLVRWFVALPVAVHEDDAGWHALSRSAALIKGRRWPILGLSALLLLSFASLSAVARHTYASIPDDDVPTWASAVVESGSPAASRIAWIVHSALYLALGLYAVVVQSVTYYRLRQEKEGIDVEAVASVFE